MIRAPDEFIYPPPFNIIEIFLVAPFECVRISLRSYVELSALSSRFFVSDETYTKARRHYGSIRFSANILTLY